MRVIKLDFGNHLKSEKTQMRIFGFLFVTAFSRVSFKNQVYKLILYLFYLLTPLLK